MNESIEYWLEKRISTRAFLDKDVAADVIESLLTKTSKAASGGNLQPWHIHVLGGEAKDSMVNAVKEQIFAGNQQDQPDIAVYPEDLKQPYKSRRFECGMALYGALEIGREDSDKRIQAWINNYEFFGAPVGIIITIDAQMGKAQYVDIGIFVQTFMLLAEEAGLATCPQLAWSAWPVAIRKELGLDDSHHVVMGIALGHADAEHPVNQYKTSRAPLEEFVTLKGF